MNQQLSERDVRIQKVEKMKTMGIIPFAQSYDKTHSIGDIINEYSSKTLRDSETIVANPEIQVSTAGRITLYRSHGKLAFARLLDSTDQIQLMFHRDNCNIIVNQEKKSELLLTRHSEE
jgi:lysyl-tRNA synthetase class 2